MEGAVPVPGVDGAGVVGAGVVVSLFEGAAGADGAGALLVSSFLSLQAARPRSDTAATEAIRNFFTLALLPRSGSLAWFQASNGNIAKRLSLFSPCVAGLPGQSPLRPFIDTEILSTATVTQENGSTAKKFSQIVLPSVIKRQYYRRA
ncbi:hypothetical protein AVM02_11425 [Brucella anthropi]